MSRAIGTMRLSRESDLVSSGRSPTSEDNFAVAKILYISACPSLLISTRRISFTLSSNLRASAMMAQELHKGLRHETRSFLSEKTCTGPRSARHMKGAKQQRRCCRHEALSAKIVAAATLEAPSKNSSLAATLSSAYSKAKQVANKQVCIVTGASSGLGLATAKKLADSGEWHVILACRDFLKAERMARKSGLSREDYTVMHLDLSSLESVRQFVDNFRRSELPLDCLVCNAAVYLPTAKEPRFTADGFEISVGTNHLGHFLLANLLLEDLKKRNESARNPPRMVIVGSITGNTNTVAGNVPPKANLGDLRGLAGGLNAGGSVMIDGMDFDGAKAYKDSKVCNMLTMGEMHRRFHKDTGVVFSSLYPGCIAETGLFREHYKLFRTIFPVFQKYVTKGYVSEEEAGTRLAQVVSKPDLGRSGVYWSWNKENGSFENELSEESSDLTKAKKLYDISLKLVGLS